MKQHTFANRAKETLEPDENVIGLAVAGSWITGEIDEFSDLDLIIVTREKISGNIDLMITYAKRLGQFLSGFTGEHVGEPRVLICLFDDPLLHVDIKFLTLDEFHVRVETPVLLLDKGNVLQEAIDQSDAKFPLPDYQWIEDRFWVWVHYVLDKIARGELFEAYDGLGFLRMVVFGPLLQIKNGNLPRGVRKVEIELAEDDLRALETTISNYDKQSLFLTLRNAVILYQDLRLALFGDEIKKQQKTEHRVMAYFDEIEARFKR